MKYGGRPYLTKRGLLTQEQIELIDYACQVGVEYAEQTYRNNPKIDRNKLAIDYAFKVIEKAGMIPDNLLFIIKGMIEAKVYDLPPTHDAEGNII